MVCVFILLFVSNLRLNKSLFFEVSIDNKKGYVASL